MPNKLLNEMENKTQTALQILLQRLNSVKPNQLCSIETIKGWAVELLKTEKQQLLDIVVWFDDTDRRPKEIEQSAEQYYSQTFERKNN